MNQNDYIVQEVSSFLHTYLKAGTVQLHSFTQKIHQGIERFEELFVIRFLLQKETKEFVQDLPSLIRNIKTTTSTEQQVSVAEVRGAIDWAETSRLRMNQNYKDQLTFVTKENIRAYDTQENLVLKRLLITLYNELYTNEYVRRFYRYNWFSEWDALKENLQIALRKNVYLQRVPNVRVSNRMLHNTKKHRNSLYKRAAKLLLQYRRFMERQFEQHELEQLLRETFILPDNQDVLFELYWIIQLIKKNRENSTLHLLDGSNNIVASWEDDQLLYKIYHDAKGSEELSFTTYRHELEQGNNRYIRQVHASFQVVNDYKEKYFGRERTEQFRQGRPDLIVEVRQKETGKLEKLIIGEVKNTKNVHYAVTGMQELLDYIHLVKSNDEYLGDQIMVKGLLCVDEIDWHENSSEEDLIQIVTPVFREGLKI